MRFIKRCGVLLGILTLTIVGCGGGGGGSASSSPESDTIAPTVNSFTLPPTSTSMTVPISFSATDNVDVSGYLITETAPAPSANATGWSAVAPVSFTFSGAGTFTAYAWAKDAAGNVSSSRLASVTITLADSAVPVVSAFTLPATSTSKTVTISSLSATDNIGVTGYIVTENSTSPSASANGWSTTVPVSYTFSGTGSLTAYAWAKDAAGNVSLSRSAPVTITLADSAAPTVTAFTLPSTSISLNVAISSLSATDDFGVTGYIVTESASAPSASAAGWSATAQTFYVFTGAGSRTLYAWAKDAAGNVSAARSASVIITLADTAAPTVTAFTLPSTSVSMTVAISSLSATDDFGVTGYFITESSTAPPSSSGGWILPKPAYYTFSGEGTKTAYAWAKDAAGNVSTAISATVTITLPPKTVTLKFSSQSTNSSDLIGGFELRVFLPVGSVISTDTTGKPLQSSVYLSGKFAGGTPPMIDLSYDSALRKLQVLCASASDYQLGEFITILVTTPNSSKPSDISYLFKPLAPITGDDLPNVTATFTFI